MSVMRNTFSGELSASPNLSTSYKTHTITGLTSETSTTNINYMNAEASLHFLNALHKTLVDAGYGDAVKNGEPLGGKASAESDFATDDDEDFLN